MAASRFIRFFSRRQTKTSHNHLNSKFLSNEKSQEIIRIKNGLVCTIILLDGEDVNFEVDVSYKNNHIEISMNKFNQLDIDLFRHIVIYMRRHVPTVIYSVFLASVKVIFCHVK